ncbi:MAG: 2-C-methyl-D-erythritol 4-phosphate cytidylyltransferase [Chthoniobacterales bacterium]|nr:2-C-methyl-D-erythritol 4-phosphate cytidylyltransferase [Chthoniobacterales bacterium]
MEIQKRQQQQKLSSSGLSYNAAIIVAAGSSLRFGEDKLMALVQDRPLITYSLRTFAAIPSMEEIILVVATGREESFSQLVKEMNLADWNEKIKIVPGGKDRHESVQHGLHALSEGVEWIAIHDGARPLISGSMIELTFQKAHEHGAAALATRVTETLHRVDKKFLADITVDRTDLWSMQTPQVFRKADLIGLPALQENQSPTDEVSALLQRGIKTYLVENREPNIKVTYPEDLKLVTAYLSTFHKP